MALNPPPACRSLPRQARNNHPHPRSAGIRREAPPRLRGPPPELLKARVARQARIDAGEMPDFLPETKHIREGDWKVARCPPPRSAAASKSPARSKLR